MGTNLELAPLTVLPDKFNFELGLFGICQDTGLLLQDLTCNRDSMSGVGSRVSKDTADVRS